MHKSFIRKCGAAVCALGMMFCLAASVLPAIAKAAEPRNMTLICRSSDVDLADMPWNIYLVGERTVENSLQLTGDFAEYPVSIGNLTSTSELQDAADTLENYAVIDKITPLSTGKTDENGSLCFDGLEIGIYLIAGESITIGETKYIPSPTLLEVSASDEVYDITVYPKIQEHKTITSDKTVYTVKKVWVGDENDLSVRPESIVLQFYCGENLDREITLSDENDWSYTWESDVESVWNIKELNVPENYSVVYRGNEVQYLVVNTYKASVGTTVAATSAAIGKNEAGGTTKLPQTGQLWWPVPVLIALGLILIVVGARLHAKNRQEQ